MNVIRAMLALVLAAVLGCSAAADPPAQTPPPSGTFSGEGLTVTLKRDGNSYTGRAALKDAEFVLRGVFDPAKGLRGTFVAAGQTFEWSAVVDGSTLRFETGGTEYKLRIPSAAPANPVAKPPEKPNPLAQKPPVKPGMDGAAETLKFTRLGIKDPDMNHAEAVSLLIPQGWRHEGGVKWLHDYSILANLQLRVSDPETGAAIQFLPMQNFSWVENPVVPMQPGANYMGNIVYPPVRDIAEFIRLFYTSQQSMGLSLPHLADARPAAVDELPEIARLVGQAYGGGSSVAAARARYEYQQGGKPWQEDVYVTLVYTSQQGQHIWSVASAYSLRAPKAEFEKLSPRMAASVASLRIGPDWFAGYMYVQQLFSNRQAQGIRDAAAISQTISRNSEEIRQMFSDSYKRQSESQDRISRSLSESIRGVETYRNPFEDRPIQLPAGYRETWVNSKGEYVLSTQSGFDPNVGSTVEWRRMEQEK